MSNEIEKLQIALQKDPSNFQIRRQLTILLIENGFNEEALSNLKYLIKYFPNDEELHYNLGILYEKMKDVLKDREKLIFSSLIFTSKVIFLFNNSIVQRFSGDKTVPMNLFFTLFFIYELKECVTNPLELAFSFTKSLFSLINFISIIFSPPFLIIKGHPLPFIQ